MNRYRPAWTIVTSAKQQVRLRMTSGRPCMAVPCIWLCMMLRQHSMQACALGMGSRIAGVLKHVWRCEQRKAADVQVYEAAVRRRGRPAAGQKTSIPLAEMPYPLPLSRFQWPSVSSPALERLVCCLACLLGPDSPVQSSSGFRVSDDHKSFVSGLRPVFNNSLLCSLRGKLLVRLGQLIMRAVQMQESSVCRTYSLRHWSKTAKACIHPRIESAVHAVQIHGRPGQAQGRTTVKCSKCQPCLKPNMQHIHLPCCALIKSCMMCRSRADPARHRGAQQ